MIDFIDPKTAKIPFNYVLIKPDPTYAFHEIPTADGKVSLQLTYFNQDKSKYLSISGSVVMLPEQKWFFANKSDGQGDEFAAMVRNSLEFDAPCSINVGDRVFFDYREQIDVEQERRIVRTADYGLCVLVRQDRLYGKYANGDLVPVNGYVFFKRDQMPDTLELFSGILLTREHDKYEMNTATVLSADVACTAHLEGELEPATVLGAGTRIVMQKNRGFRISYEIGNDDLRDIEVCHRKDIAGVRTTECEPVKMKSDAFYKWEDDYDRGSRKFASI